MPRLATSSSRANPCRQLPRSAAGAGSNRVRTALALVILMFVVPLLFADYHHVVSDNKTDFSTLKTFSIREGRATTTRPELNNRLIFKKVEDAIRVQLSTKGLTEA